jgi:hypothetical protein
MKYDTFEDNVCCSGGKLYRDCLLVNLKTFQIEDHIGGFVDDPKDLIISDDDIPEGYIIVDSLMAPIILDLNRKGYKTLYSCQGHFDKNIYNGEGGEKYSGVTATYIVFEAGPHLDRYINNLLSIPRQFEVRIDNGKLADSRDEELEKTYGVHRDKGSNKRISIYSSMPYIYTDDMEMIDYDKIDPEMFNRYNRADLMMLGSWVRGLPDLTKETTKQCEFDSKPTQEYKGDFIGSYNNTPYTIEEINEQITTISDTLVNIGKRMKDIKLVEEIDDIDDTSMYESYIIRKNFPTKGYKEMVKNIKKV